MGYQLFKVRQYLQGWINYFGIANAYQYCVELDHWIRRRVRMCYWRQWRKPRTKVANLLSAVSGFNRQSLAVLQAKGLGEVQRHREFNKR